MGDRRQRTLNDGLVRKAEHLGHFTFIAEMCGRPGSAQSTLPCGEHETPERRKHRSPRPRLATDVVQLRTRVHPHTRNDQPRRFVQPRGQVIQAGRDPLSACRRRVPRHVPPGLPYLQTCQPPTGDGLLRGGVTDEDEIPPLAITAAGRLARDAHAVLQCRSLHRPGEIEPPSHGARGGQHFVRQ
jgi:hypothetical protein